jgi:pseudouridine-5'-phosphate glycosidase/pseudouridine kinase
MRTDGIKTLPAPGRTAQYVAVNNAHKDLTLAMADMSILESVSPDAIASTWREQFAAKPSPKYVIVDANWDPAGLHTWLEQARLHKAMTMFEPVSTAKATRLFGAVKESRKASIYPNHLVDIATPNSHELLALHNTANDLGLFESGEWFTALDALGIPSSGLRVPLAQATTPALVDAGIPQQAIKMLPFIPTLLTKLGPNGVLLTKVLSADDPALTDPDELPYVLARNTNGDQAMNVGGLYVRLFPTERVLAPEEVVSVNGIGDTFLGALASGLVAGKKLEDVIPLAQRAAALSLTSKESVSPELKGLSGLITSTA